MKALFALALSACIATAAMAQESGAGDLLTIGFQPMKGNNSLTDAQVDDFNTRIEFLSSANGISGSGESENFVLTGNFNLLNQQASAGGMRSIHTTSANITLSVKESKGGKVFSTMSRRLESSGQTPEIAITNAIQEMQPEDEDVKKFFKESREKIIGYYEKNCGNLLAEGKARAQQRNFVGAIAKLYSIPPEAKACFAQAQPVLFRTYDDYQKQACGIMIQKSKAALAKYDFNQAVEELAGIDPTGPCKTQLAAHMKAMEGKIDKQNDRQWSIYNKLVDARVLVAEGKYEAIREVLRYNNGNNPRGNVINVQTNDVNK